MASITRRSYDMTKKQESGKPKRRTQIKELPKEEKELSKEEQKKIKGGDFIEKRYTPPPVT